MNRLKEKYQTEVVAKMKDEFGLKNNLSVPKLLKIVINVGLGEAKDNKALLDRVVADVTALGGQKPLIAKAKQSISSFKLAKGQPIGVTVTLRGDRMYQFLDKLIGIVLPKVRDFRGLPNKGFDGQGNFTLGLREQAMFPEVSFQSNASGSKGKGLEVSIVSTARTKEQGKRFLELLGMPFIKEQEEK